MKLILITIFLIVSSNLFSQSTKEKVSGIGKFKIGKTCWGEMDTLSKNAGEGWLIEDVSDLDSRVLIYKSDYYKIGGFELKNLVLSFYKDTLFKIEFDGSPDLLLAFHDKFSVIRTDIKKQKVKCRTGLKIEYTENEKINCYNFLSVKNVFASATIGVEYDSRCKKVNVNFWFIYSEPKETYLAKTYNFANPKKIDNSKIISDL